jgi:hypothetical protein
VEALAALVIVGVALVPLLSAVGDGMRAQGRLAAHLDAVALAEARMGALALLPTDSIAAYLRPREGAFPEPAAAYRWRALLRPERGTPALVRAAVLVRWPGGEYSLETVFHRPELAPPPAALRGDSLGYSGNDAPSF